MSNFMLIKQHLREVLLYCFNWKKSEAEAHRMLVEVYCENAPTDKSCREWFRRFKDGDFSVEDKPRPGQPKKFEEKKLEALLDEDPTQTQDELADTLEVTQQAVSVRLKSIGMIQKQSHWVSHELKPRDVERRFFSYEQLIERQKRKGFLHRIMTGDEKWIFYDIPKKKKYYAVPGQSLPSTLISTPKSNIHGSKVMLCIWWDQKGVVYYELLQPGESITGDRYRLQLISLSQALREKRPEYEHRHDKVILLLDNARPHAAKVVKDI
jgi:[histone H3]-lysine36 N-dimethyltransferase SETMAR